MNVFALLALLIVSTALIRLIFEKRRLIQSLGLNTESSRKCQEVDRSRITKLEEANQRLGDLSSGLLAERAALQHENKKQKEQHAELLADLERIQSRLGEFEALDAQKELAAVIAAESLNT